VKVVTYARVSTIAQETEGQSLVNQERAFQTWLKRSNATRLRAYTEAKSAKSVEGREQFMRMIAELPKLKPDLVVVDTVDRFTRNLQDGLAMLEQLKGQGVKLLPLERGEPIDLDDDRDWKDITQDMMAADYERRRNRTRINRSFAGRRERGATLHNRPPLGLKKEKDRLVPHPEYGPVIKQVDKMYIAGKTQDEILAWVQTALGEKAWKSRNGVKQCVSNRAYVTAGLRTPETQARMDEITAVSKKRFGQKRLYVHPMAGVFTCGICVDLGHPADKSLMSANCTPGEMRSWGRSSAGARIICQGKQRKRHPYNVAVQERYLEMIFVEVLSTLKTNELLLKSWETQRQSEVDNSQERLLQKRLAAIEQKEAKLPTRREQVLELLEDADRSVVNQAKKLLKQLDEEEATLASDRETILHELATAASAKPVQKSYDLQTMLAKAVKSWPKFSNERKNEIAQAFCNAVGSYPVLYKGKAVHPVEAVVSWHEIIPNAVYRVLYGKGITAKVELIPVLQSQPKPEEMPANVTELRASR
jgi:DNA invertase Pin-like site-specific DNA recombinase